MTPEQIAAHESAHAAAAVVLGTPVRLIDTVANGDVLGGVWHDLRVTDRDTARRRAMVILAGLIESAETADDLPRWPLDPHPIPGSDEQKLGTIGELLGWDEQDYENMVAETCRLMLSTSYGILFTTISGALNYTPRLDQKALRRLLAIAIKRMEDD